MKRLRQIRDAIYIVFASLTGHKSIIYVTSLIYWKLRFVKDRLNVY